MEPSKEEDLGNPPEDDKNWRGMVIAVLVIFTILTLIVVAIIFVSPKKVEEELGDPLTLEDLSSGEYDFREISPHWKLDENVYIYKSKDGELVEYDIDKDASTLVMSNSTFRELNTDIYLPSADHQFILLSYDVELIWRHYSKARYKIYNRHASSLKLRLIDFPPGENWLNRKLDLVQWSPIGHALSFVCDGNLYFQPDPLTTPTLISGLEDASPGKKLYRGLADFMYQEEIFHSSIAHWWSPDGTLIAYMVTDDTNVPVYKYPTYDDVRFDKNEFKEVHYPKAGSTKDGQLPSVKVIVVKTINPTNSHVHLRPPNQLSKTHHFVHNVVWTDSKHMVIVWSNRVQNSSIITQCDVTTGHCKENVVEAVQEGHGWLEPLPVLRYVEDWNSILTLLPRKDGDHGYWKHVALISLSMTGLGTKTFITEGLWEATDIVGYCKSSKSVFFIGTSGDPRQRHLFRLALQDTSQHPGSPVCLTCNRKDECQYVDASFSQTGMFYILGCLGPGIPRYIIQSTGDNKDTEKIVEDNSDLRQRLSSKAIPRKEYYELESSDTKGIKMSMQVLLPPVLKKEQILVYPVVLFIDGRPGSQSVTFRYDIGFQSFLASTEDAIVVSVDGRGSGGRGERWKRGNNRRLDNIQVLDQIKAIQFLVDSFSYVNKDQISIVGEGYGGYLGIKALGSSDLFKSGVFTAPIVDWRYYNSIYTEKMLGLFHENFKVYDDAKISVKSGMFSNKSVLLIHGTADENVHFQHTAQLVKSLADESADFNVQVYPDERHIFSHAAENHKRLTTIRYLRNFCWASGLRNEKAAIQQAE